MLLTRLVSCLAVLAWCLGTVARAEVYKCESAGEVKYQNMPCAPSAAHAASVAIPSGAGVGTITGKRPEFTQFLNPACASLYEAIHHPNVRPTYDRYAYERSNALRTEYSEKCSVEEQYARNKVFDAQRANRQAAVNEITERNKQEKASQEQKNYCAQMKDTLDLKKKRLANLNETEVEALRQFEAQFRQRCLGQPQ